VAASEKAFPAVNASRADGNATASAGLVHPSKRVTRDGRRMSPRESLIPAPEPTPVIVGNSIRLASEVESGDALG